MTTQSNRVHRNDVRKPASAKANNYTLSGPAEFKTIRLRECPVNKPNMDAAPDVIDFWCKHVATALWFKDDKECLCVFLLNAHHEVFGFELVSLGTLDMLFIHPRDVFRPAFIHSAAAIVIAHNHPSGNPTPSDGDIKVTRELIRGAEVLKIQLLDHIIIGDARQKKTYSSFRELGYFSDVCVKN